MTDPTPRPKQHLTAAGRLYPGAWRQADEMRAGRGKNLPSWPDWCYLPLSGWYAIVCADAGVASLDFRHLNRVGDIGRLAALGTWRVTQGIYRFDRTLYDALVATPLEGDLPAELFLRLPEWCVYIETPDYQWLDTPLYGFFAHLEWDTNTERMELRLLLDAEAALQPLPIHMGQWPLQEAVQRAVQETKRQMIHQGATALAANVPAKFDFQVEALVSLLLYLCAENADIGDGAGGPANPVPKRTKHGWRLFPPDKVQGWAVGTRIGAALRRGSAETVSGDTSGTHASPRPHIRRAHWHTYLVGTGRSEKRVKWLPPIPVNVADIEALPATVRPVLAPHQPTAGDDETTL